MDDLTDTIQKQLDKLASNEIELSKVERDAEIYRLKKTQDVYGERSKIVSEIPKFWYIVVAENDDFADYISDNDLKYLETIKNIEVVYNFDFDDKEIDKKFDITFTFESDEALIPNQVVKKSFYTKIVEGEETIFSSPAEIKWPSELLEINPQLIKSKFGTKLDSQQKKNYRLGMKSFFAWFNWTGEKPGKEFRNGEDLTRLIIDDLYLNAVKYYVLAINNDDDQDEENEVDSSEGEELDLSDNEGDIKKDQLDDEHVNKKQKR